MNGPVSVELSVLGFEILTLRGIVNMVLFGRVRTEGTDPCMHRRRLAGEAGERHVGAEGLR